MENNTLTKPIALIVDKKTANGMNPLVLAYIGDGVFDLYVRTYMISKSKGNVNQLHRATTQYVKASAQALIIRELLNFLSEEELVAFKRGRNQKSHTVAKNATLTDYRAATGFESLVGWLYITGQFERLETLVMMALEIVETIDKP